MQHVLRGKTHFHASHIILIISALLTLSLAGFMAFAMRRGFDFTDEAFYLIWSLDPNAYDLMYQPFGYVFNVILSVSGSLWHFRLTGLAFVLLSGAHFGWVLSRVAERLATPACLIVGTSSSLLFYYSFILTPSYNLIANAAAFSLCAIAVFMTGMTSSRQAVIASFFLAGCLSAIAFFMKAPVALVLSLIIAATSVYYRCRGDLGLFVVSTIMAIVAGIITFSVFYPLPQIGALLSQIFLTQQTLNFPNQAHIMPVKAVSDLVLSVSLVPYFILLATSFAVPAKAARPFLWLIAAGAVASIGYHSLRAISELATNSHPPSNIGSIGLTAVLLLLSYGIVTKKLDSLSIVRVAIIALCPVVISLGTFNPTVPQLRFSTPFFLIAVIIIIDKTCARATSRLVPLSVALLAWSLLGISAFRPYGLNSTIFHQHLLIDHPLGVGRVKVDNETFQLVQTFSNAAPGARVIDLTAGGPALPIILGGRSPTLPWFTHITPEWLEVAWGELDPNERAGTVFLTPITPSKAKSSPAIWFSNNIESFCVAATSPFTIWRSEAIQYEVWRLGERNGASSACAEGQMGRGLDSAALNEVLR